MEDIEKAISAGSTRDYIEVSRNERRVTFERR
jgi:hypothetical protein